MLRRDKNTALVPKLTHILQVPRDATCALLSLFTKDKCLHSEKGREEHVTQFHLKHFGNKIYSALNKL